MADRSRCPRCGERVSPYAAGCAICGADLDTARWDSGPGRAQRASDLLSAISFGRGGTHGRDYGKWLLIGLLALVAVAMALPYFGVY